MDPSAFDPLRPRWTKDKQTGLSVVDERAYYERISWGIGEGVLILGDS